MKQNIIKYWNQKSLIVVSIINLIVIVFFIILSAIFIITIEEKLINIFLILLVNITIILIIYGFSKSSTSYETVYQIKTDNQGYNTKLYRYILILLGIGWLIFFILNALYMLTQSAVDRTGLDYFAVLSKKWWILLIISFYHVFLIAVHRQLIHYVIHHQELPWEKIFKKNKKQL